MRYRERLATVVPPNDATLVAAASVWVGCLLGLALGSSALVLPLLSAAAAAVLRRSRVALVGGLVFAGAVSGGLAAERMDAAQSVPVPSGRLGVIGRVTADPVPGEGGGELLLVAAAGTGTVGAGTVFLITTDQAPPVLAGDVVQVEGVVADRRGRHRGDPYRAVLGDAEVAVVETARGPLFGPGNRLRSLVLARLADAGEGDSSGLLAGFLVGDTTRLSEPALDALRRSGLTHYVAVSGSNVAIFLGAWWLVVGPLRLHPQVRAAAGLVALAVFVVITRWEPSVVRAAAMASVVLGGGMLGVPVDTWRALGVAVAGLLLVSGDLAAEIGFQLSVAATAGVLVAARLAPERRPRWAWTALSATMGAQMAVLPIVLWRFDSVPLLSPVTNVVAAPLVTVATALGGLGVITGLRPMLDVALVASHGVVFVAEHAAGWPQLGSWAAVVVLAAGGVAAAVRKMRPVVVVTGVAMAAAAWLPGPAPTMPTVTFLDVGQGDAIVIRDGAGSTALVDGGREQAVLRAALRRQGVTDIDLLVATHGDADHVGGLPGMVADYGVDAVWYPQRQATGDLLDAVLVEAAAEGVTATPVGVGGRTALGAVTIELLGPTRRYAADNDGSVVMLVSAGDVDVLLTGDVQGIGQGDLPPLQPDVLQVPHHGSATTDIGWLLATVGDVAVISVGPNTYGHPAAAIVEALEEGGVEVHTTWDDGDIVVPLCVLVCASSP